MIEEKIKKVIANALDVNLEDVSDDSSQDTLKNWDSLGHTNIIMSLEEAFNVHFTDEQAVKMINYHAIVDTVREALQRQN